MNTSPAKHTPQKAETTQEIRQSIFKNKLHISLDLTPVDIDLEEQVNWSVSEGKESEKDVLAISIPLNQIQSSPSPQDNELKQDKDSSKTSKNKQKMLKYLKIDNNDVKSKAKCIDTFTTVILGLCYK